MTKALLRQIRREFHNDPDIYDDMSRFSAFVYDESESDAYFDRQQNLGRIHLAVMRDDDPIGEVILKHLDPPNCTLSIHLKNDSVKNQGYGTKAEILAVQYAFHELAMETVYADALIKNTRSQHVLDKAGFQQTHRDDTFCYYCCKKTQWLAAQKAL